MKRIYILTLFITLFATLTVSQTQWSNVDGTSAKYILFADSLNGIRTGLSAGVQQTSDGGTTWAARIGLPTAAYNGFHMFNANHVIVGAASVAPGQPGFVARTNDGWATVDSTAIASADSGSVLGIAVGSDSNAVYSYGTDQIWRVGAGIYGFIESSTDGGTSWSLISAAALPCINDLEVVGDTLVAACDSGIIGVSLDNGNSWQRYTATGVKKFTSLARVAGSAQTVVVGYTTGTRYGVVYDVDLMAAPTLMHKRSEVSDVQDVYMLDAFNGISCGTSGGFGAIWETHDGGMTWAEVYSNGANGGTIYNLTFVSAARGWATGQKGLYMVYGGALPIQLAAFYASVAEGAVELSWSTASETNNYGFYVERRMEIGGYQTISALIPGAGTTLEEQSYSYRDGGVPSVGVYYYRIRQVDLNGDVSYSPDVKVEVANVLAVADDGTVLTYGLQQNYPNPFNPATIIEFTLPMESQVTVKIFNMLGQEVAGLLNSELAAGKHEVKFNASNLPSGVYTYRLTAGVYTEARKMLLAR